MITNQQFADAVGCHHSMASRLRSGKRLPSIDLMSRISDAFGISMTALVQARQEGADAFGSMLTRRVFNSKAAQAKLDKIAS